MSELRDRIAAAVMRHWENEPCCTCRDCAQVAADAVIRELNLTEHGGVIVGCAHD